MDDIRLGAILLEGGIVDEAALERCLSIQALTGGTRPIGQILVHQGLIAEDALKQQLALQLTRFEERAARVNATDAKSRCLLDAARANHASELVVSEGRFVRIRVGTEWRKLLDDVVRGPEVWDFVREIMGNEVLEELADHQFVIRPIVEQGAVCGTATAFRQFDGVAVRVTLFDKEAMSPVEAGIPEQIVETVAKRLMPHTDDDLSLIAPGDGAIVSWHGEQLAVSRDEGGELHPLSAHCTHLGCEVAWNSAMRTWDCGCHGSCFDAMGSVLRGPAVRPLEARDEALAGDAEKDERSAG